MYTKETNILLSCIEMLSEISPDYTCEQKQMIVTAVIDILSGYPKPSEKTTDIEHANEAGAYLLTSSAVSTAMLIQLGFMDFDKEVYRLAGRLEWAMELLLQLQ